MRASTEPSESASLSVLAEFEPRVAESRPPPACISARTAHRPAVATSLTCATFARRGSHVVVRVGDVPGHPLGDAAGPGLFLRRRQRLHDVAVGVGARRTARGAAADVAEAALADDAAAAASPSASLLATLGAVSPAVLSSSRGRLADAAAWESMAALPAPCPAAGESSMSPLERLGVLRLSTDGAAPMAGTSSGCIRDTSSYSMIRLGRGRGMMASRISARDTWLSREAMAMPSRSTAASEGMSGTEPPTPMVRFFPPAGGPRLR